MALTHADVDWNKIPKNAISILKILRNNEKSKYKPLDLADKVSQNPRTVRYALKKLLDLGYVSREPDLEDLRTFYYFVQSDEVIEQDIEEDLFSNF
ncbi:MAG: winged helix-turn-helix domain-containing protein [Candidatus Hodarchaeales archaeon]|jgi:DNA-binding MarR family transcriptional regulator